MELMDNDEVELFEQMIIENGRLLHSLAGLLIRKGILSRDEVDEEMKKLEQELTPESIFHQKKN